jgi:hypothetical protein
MIVKQCLTIGCAAEITFTHQLFDVELEFLVVGLLNVLNRGGVFSHQGCVTTAIRVIDFAQGLEVASRKYPDTAEPIRTEFPQ